MRSKIGLMGLLLALIVISLFSLTPLAQQDGTATPEPTQAMSGMGDGMGSMDTDFSSDELVPLVRGIFNGEDVFFIHTETSDEAISTILTDMMGPVLVTVPMLADIPEELLANVYVFTNGISGAGPLGFQPDIFDNVPDSPEYSPLRTLNLVTWQEGSTPRLLNNLAEIDAAHEADELIIEQPGVVINMPILVWSEGQR
ncbi:MAG: hypothetical protein Q9P01_18965 [Anaerolineae bacterium]|nr:hypothetical protein [Anaerolineae bacterium]